MTQPRTPKPKFAICVQNEHYPASLEIGKVYRILPDAAAAKVDCVRVIDESGEDYLYPALYFASITLPPSVSQLLSARSMQAQAQ